MGLAIERGILRLVEGDVIRTIIVTFGISLIIANAAHLEIIFGATAYRMPNPVPFNIVLPWLTYSGFRTVAAIISLGILIALLAFLFKTKFGLWIRAGRTDKEMASAMGIDIGKVSIATFVIGAAIAGIAGALVTSVAPIVTHMGTEALVYAFLVVIIGGLGSFKGTIIAGFIVAMIDSLGGILLTPLLAKVLLLSLLIVILIFRPKGLYGVWGE
jgi:branched-chain amino acid transport system permease protein